MASGVHNEFIDIIPDTRFPNEIEKMRDCFDCSCVHVSRPGFENSLTEEQRNHPSETALNGYLFDHELTNDGTPEGIKREVDNLISKLIRE